MNVAQVDLNNGETNAHQGIAEGDGVVGQPAGIDDNSVRPAPMLLNCVDQDAFVVRLKCAQIYAKAIRRFFQGILDLLERLLSIDVRLAKARHIDIRSMEDEHLYFSLVQAITPLTGQG